MVGRFALLVAALLVVSPHGATADVLEIPLEIASPDFPDVLAVADFHFDLPLPAVTRISLRLVGEYREVIYVVVSAPYNYGTRPVHLDMCLGDDVAVSPLVCERHQFPAGEGSFDFEVVLLDRDSGDWSPLADGVGQVGVECGPGSIQGYDGEIASAASSWGAVAAATLIVSYDASVPTAPAAWSAVKARYR